jgi:DNA polymerase III subunit delta'
MGARPDRKRQLAAIDLARAVAAGRMETSARSAIPGLSDTHADLVRLAAQAPTYNFDPGTYNFDPGLLVMEIGTLLASLAVPSAPKHG